MKISILNKQRSGDANLWKMIIFWIGITIAVGVVSLMAFYYQDYRTASSWMSVLSSSSNSDWEFEAAWFCDDGESVSIDYSAVSGEFTLECRLLDPSGDDADSVEDTYVSEFTSHGVNILEDHDDIDVSSGDEDTLIYTIEN